MELVHALHLDCEATQVAKAIQLLSAFIFHEVGGHPLTSGLIHFLAILGINANTRRLRLAPDYSYILAGVVYCTRVIAVEALLPAAQREHQGKPARLHFLRQRRSFLVDGSYSPFSAMISLLAYAKHITLSGSNAATTLWSKDQRILYFCGRPIVIDRFKAMVAGVLAAAEAALWGELLMVAGPGDRFSVPLQDMEDNPTDTTRGYSFLIPPGNGLAGGLPWAVQRLMDSVRGRKMRTHGQWHHPAVQAYIRQTNAFLEALFFLTHLTAGQPARGTEIGSARFRNGYMQDRNIFIIDGQLAFVSRYNKTQSQWDKPKVIPRFLPWPVGQLLAVYLAYVCPLREHLLGHVLGQPQSDYLWSNSMGPWDTERFSRVLQRETGIWLGCRLGMLEYRHAAITIGREFVGQDFAHNTQPGAGEGAVEEPEVELEGGLDLQAGRTERIGLQSYGVAIDIVQHLSARSVQFFRALSTQWHLFLGLPSTLPTPKGSAGVAEQRLKRPQLSDLVPSAACPGAELNKTPTCLHPPKRRRDSPAPEPSPASLQVAVEKALSQSNASYRSEEQRAAL
jgi:hypothetical protein